MKEKIITYLWMTDYRGNYISVLKTKLAFKGCGHYLHCCIIIITITIIAIINIIIIVNVVVVVFFRRRKGDLTFNVKGLPLNGIETRKGTRYRY